MGLIQDMEEKIEILRVTKDATVRNIFILERYQLTEKNGLFH